MPGVQESLKVIKRGCQELLLEQEMAQKLELGRPLRVKAGFDPTAPDLHLGHTVLLSKMRQFQELGHHVIFLIGDFTGMIGDPTGKNATRPPLSREQIEDNARTYRDQVSKSSIRADRDRFQLDLVRPYARSGSHRLAAKHTVARMLERDEFRQALPWQPADRYPRVSVSLGAGLRLRRVAGGRRAGRHRPEVQPAGRASCRSTTISRLSAS